MKKIKVIKVWVVDGLIKDKVSAAPSLSWPDLGFIIGCDPPDKKDKKDKKDEENDCRR